MHASPPAGPPADTGSLGDMTKVAVWSSRQTVPWAWRGLDAGFLPVGPKPQYNVSGNTPEVTDLMVDAGSSKQNLSSGNQSKLYSLHTHSYGLRVKLAASFYVHENKINMLCLHLWLVFAPGDWHIFLTTKIGNITLCGKLDLLLLTPKGASECEIADFPTRHTLQWKYCQKEKKIPETHSSWVSEPRNYLYPPAVLAGDCIPGIRSIWDLSWCYSNIGQ